MPVHEHITAGAVIFPQRADAGDERDSGTMKQEAGCHGKAVEMHTADFGGITELIQHYREQPP